MKKAKVRFSICGERNISMQEYIARLWNRKKQGGVMMKKLFTLIELIVVIVVIGILAAIVVPNISSQQKEATKTAVVSNVRNLQTSVDMYSLKNNGAYPVDDLPEVGFPEPINFELIQPKYTRTIPKKDKMKYWIDYQGRVWASSVDSPKDIVESETKLVWSEVEDAEKYNVYEINAGTTSAIDNNPQLKYIQTVDTGEFTTDTATKEYAVSSVDAEGFESPPAKVGYVGYKEQESLIPIEPVNQQPVAKIVISPNTKILTTTNLTYSYSGSTDPDGDEITNAEWKLNNGSIVSSLPTRITTAGENVISLRVQDAKGMWSEWVEQKVFVFNQINTLGSTMGNAINSYGYYTFQDGWIYFADESTGKLHKMKRDGTSKTLIYNYSVGNVNVIGEWVYFTSQGGIYKIKVDGSDLTLISSDSVYRSMIVAGNWIYYVNRNDGYSIYKISTNGTGRMKVNNDHTYFMNYNNGVLYYENVSDNRYIYKINANGTGRTLVKAVSVYELNVTDNYIYYTNGSIQRINKDGSGQTTISTDMAFALHVDNNYIYYKNNTDNGNIYRMSLTGTNKFKITNVTNTDAIHVVYDWVYYRYGSFYKVKIDGSQLTKIN